MAQQTLFGTEETPQPKGDISKADVAAIAAAGDRRAAKGYEDRQSSAWVALGGGYDGVKHTTDQNHQRLPI